MRQTVQSNCVVKGELSFFLRTTATTACRLILFCAGSFVTVICMVSVDVVHVNQINIYIRPPHFHFQ